MPSNSINSANAVDAGNVLQHQFRDAMARLGAAVNIVTTDGPAGRAGFAATAVCSVSDNPPTLLVCLNRNSSAYPAVDGNRVLCVNVVERRHEHLCRLFGGKTPVDERFAAGEWSAMPSGALRLERALVSLDCEIQSVAASGTHDILICSVKTIQGEIEGDPLIYFNRHFHAISAPQPALSAGYERRIRCHAGTVTPGITALA